MTYAYRATTKFVGSARIKVVDGPNGWRKCLSGHRMIVIKYDSESNHRIVVHDLVGVQKLSYTNLSHYDRRWLWKETEAGNLESRMAMRHSLGDKAAALWSYHPEESADGEGEMMFPRGAEITEVENVNSDWNFGICAGEKGVFPAAYVRIFKA